MRIKLIELTNFKSFKDKTTVALDRNSTVIVGKNGSGKSNLVTAIETIVCCPKIDSKSNFIHEGSDENCIIEIVFDNATQRFHGPKSFSIRREMSFTKDEFFVDNKLTSRDEIKGMFESAGIPITSPYFMVPQGKINSLALMSDTQRYSLIKSVAGVLKYEEDRKKSLEMLDETTYTQTKVENILERISGKLEGLEKDKENLDKCESLENEKRRCEIAFTQREILEISQEINKTNQEIEIETPSSEDSEEIEDIEFRLREIRKEIEKIIKGDNEFKEGNLKGSKEDLNRLEIKLENISKELSQLTQKKEKIREAYEIIFIELHGLKRLKEYVNNNTNQDNVKEDHNENSFYEEEVLNLSSQSTLNPHSYTSKINLSSQLNNTKNINFLESLKSLVEKRNEFWREEKSLKVELKGIEEGLTTIGNKMMLSGKNLHKEILGTKGVIGCVLDLFDVPDDLIPAFEAVVGRHLFSVVVEDELVVKNFPQTGITFIPLNRMSYRDPILIEDNLLFLMSDKIKITEDKFKLEDKLRTLLKYITKNVFVSSDIKSANFYSKKHKINVVTLDGDLFSNSGVITGGYGKQKKIIIEYKRAIKMKEEIEKKINKNKEKIQEINFEIEINNGDTSKLSINNKLGISNLPNTPLNSITPTLPNIKQKIQTQFQREKSAYLTNPFNFENRIKNLELKLSAIEGEDETLSENINHLTERLKKYKNEFINLQGINKNNFKDPLSLLKEKEKVLMQFLRQKQILKIDKFEDIEKEKERTRRHILYNKRLELMKKIGVESHKDIILIYPELTKEDLNLKIKEIQHSLKKYVTINRRALEQWNTFLDQKNTLKIRLNELKNNLKNIKNFIGDLDAKKEKFLEFTFEMLRNNFQYFSKRLYKELDLKLDKESIKIIETKFNNINKESINEESINKNTNPIINDLLIDLNILSGGQKTMIALCLIFSIQKIDPSPFYIFDEADANLDKQSREKITELFRETLREEDVQFIITTFKEELVECGNKFIGVSFKDKKSHAGEVTKEIVSEFLSQ